MTTTIDFYLLNAQVKQEIYPFLCRLIDKAYQQYAHLLIQTDSPEEAHYLDDLLWTFRDISFIPHQPIRHVSLSDAIFIGDTGESDTISTHILFNLTANVPTDLGQFSRIIELVSTEKKSKSQAREKYKRYKDQNHVITTHNLSQP